MINTLSMQRQAHRMSYIDMFFLNETSSQYNSSEILENIFMYSILYILYVLIKKEIKFTLILSVDLCYLY